MIIKSQHNLITVILILYINMYIYIYVSVLQMNPLFILPIYNQNLKKGIDIF